MAFLAAIPAAIGSFVGGSGLSTLGTALSVGSSIFGGIAQNNASKYQAAIAENNATIARDNAYKASQTAQEQQIQSDNEVAALIGQQEATQSASGLSTTGRSQMLTRRAAARIGRSDAQNIINAGRTESGNFLQQEADFRGEAAQARATGKTAMIGGLLNAGASFVGGAQPTRSTLGRSFRSNNDPWRGLRRAV